MNRSKCVWSISLVDILGTWLVQAILAKVGTPGYNCITPAFIHQTTQNNHYSLESFIAKIMVSCSDCSRSILAVMLFFTFFFSIINAQYPKKEKFQPISEEVKFIRCETCQKAVKHLYRKTKDLREKAPGKKVSTQKLLTIKKLSRIIPFCERRARNCFLRFADVDRKLKTWNLH